MPLFGPPSVFKLLDAGDVDGLIRLLNYPGNERIRSDAAWALAKMGSKSLGPVLRVLQGEDQLARQGAVWAIGHLGDPDSVAPLIKLLHSEDAELRAAASEALGRLGQPAVEGLRGALLDGEVRSRDAAAAALAAMQWTPTQDPAGAAYLAACGDWEACIALGEVALPALVSAFSVRDARGRAAIITALGHLGIPDALPPILRGMTDPDDVVRAAAVEAVQTMGGAAVQPLFGVLNSGDARARLGAVQALGRIGDPRAESTLLALALTDPDVGMRSTAAEALAGLGDEVVERLSHTLLDPDPALRLRVAEALDTVTWRPDGSDRAAAYFAIRRDWDGCASLGEIALDVLVVALRDRDPAVRTGAAGALFRIDSPDALEPLCGLLDDDVLDLRRAVILGLGKRGDGRAVPRLLRTAIADADHGLREEASNAIVAIGAPGVEFLVDEAGSEDAHLRLAAVWHLGEIRHPNGLDAVVTALKDKDRNVRGAAAEALGPMGDQQAVPALIDALSDLMRMVRTPAARSLGILGDARAIPALEQATSDWDETFARTATQALERIRALQASGPAPAAESSPVQEQETEALAESEAEAESEADVESSRVEEHGAEPEAEAGTEVGPVAEAAIESDGGGEPDADATADAEPDAELESTGAAEA